MYIKLGSTTLNYPSIPYDDFMVFSEVIDSQVGYEKPVLVRTIEQLDKWFGRDFTSRDYFEELINSGVTLLLTRPLDYNIEDPDIYQGSLNNRDTLRLYNVKDSADNTIYSHFLYEERELFAEPIKTTGESREFYEGNIDNLDLKRVEKRYQTLVFDIVEQPDNVLQEKSYIVFPNAPVNNGTSDTETTTTNTLYYHGDVSELVNSNYYTAEEDFSNLEDLYEKLDGVVKEENSNNIIANHVINTTFFYENLGIDLIPNYLESHHLLSKHRNLINDRIVDFWSKTIGTAGIDGNIAVTIEESLDEGNYRIIIERFGHLEIFEGPVKTTTGVERLDYQISRLSELVYCDFAEGIEELPLGTWTLKGAIEETYNYESYNNGLDEIFEEADRTFPDFFLIPDVSKYIPLDTASIEDILNDHKTFYKKILEYAEESGCQVLVENEDTKNNYLYNYTNDVFNRLVYFYRSMMLGDVSRPGYYIFIRGLLRDVYSMSTDIIYYKSIKDLSKDKNSYEETEESEDLKKYKCNYLIDNGLMYYYKEYQNGDEFETSIWMRFVLGKIKRELEKNKWRYLGEKNQGKIRENISAILNKVSSNFGIIRDLSILDIRFHLESNKVDVDIETTISDLVKNHMIVNFTINYNKQDGKYSI